MVPLIQPFCLPRLSLRSHFPAHQTGVSLAASAMPSSIVDDEDAPDKMPELLKWAARGRSTALEYTVVRLLTQIEDEDRRSRF